MYGCESWTIKKAEFSVWVSVAQCWIMKGLMSPHRVYSHRASAKVQDVVGQRRQMQRGQGLPEAAPGFFCHIGRASSSDCGPSIYMLDIYIHIYIYIYILWSQGISIKYFTHESSWASLIALLVKNSPAVLETMVWFLGWEYLLKKG